MDPTVATVLILVCTIAAFISNRLPLGVVALGVTVSLHLTDVPTLPEAFAGFCDPTVIFIASLYVVSEARDATGVTAWAGQATRPRRDTPWGSLRHRRPADGSRRSPPPRTSW
ncbi:MULTISPECIES: SLC13 family permease [unclassified Microbacterium]|uniref:SLC13 family permease n=1 Tax=unclassified Microbacterium TaxID=2609290 RepID=UPI0030180D66